MTDDRQPFDRWSVEFGEIKEHMRSIEHRLAAVEVRQIIVLETLASAKAGGKVILMMMAALSTVVGLVAAMSDGIRRFFSNL